MYYEVNAWLNSLTAKERGEWLKHKKPYEVWYEFWARCYEEEHREDEDAVT
jgi:hypothetical protein